MSSKESWGAARGSLSLTISLGSSNLGQGTLPKELRCRTPDENERGIAQTSPSVRCRTLGLRLTMGISHRSLPLHSGSERLVCGGSGFECSVLVENTRPKTAQRMRLLGRQLFWTKAGRNVRVLFGWHSPVSQKRPRLTRGSLPAQHFGTRQATELERPARISKLRAALETVMSRMYH